MVSDSTFGTLDSYDEADYKSEGFSRLTDIGDVLFVDSNDEWLSFHGLFYDSVPNTLIDYQSCQTTTVLFDSKTSSDPTFAEFGNIAFNTLDDNSGGCSLYDNGNTTSSMITFAGNSCNTYGLGQVPDDVHSDGRFCVEGSGWNSTSASCNCHLVWVRMLMPHYIDLLYADSYGDGYTREEDCDDGNVLTNDCDQDVGKKTVMTAMRSDCDEDGVPKEEDCDDLDNSLLSFLR